MACMCLCSQATRDFLEVVNRLRRRRHAGPVSWSTAVKFLAARKFDVGRAVSLYEAHENTRQREGLTRFNPLQDPLLRELRTGKFTVLVSHLMQDIVRVTRVALSTCHVNTYMLCYSNACNPLQKTVPEPPILGKLCVFPTLETS